MQTIDGRSIDRHSRGLTLIVHKGISCVKTYGCRIESMPRPPLPFRAEGMARAPKGCSGLCGKSTVVEEERDGLAVGDCPGSPWTLDGIAAEARRIGAAGLVRGTAKQA